MEGGAMVRGPYLFGVEMAALEVSKTEVGVVRRLGGGILEYTEMFASIFFVFRI